MKNTIFAERFTRAMQERGISQTTMAKLCKTTQQTVSRWCNGICEPDLNSIMIVCAFLNESPNSLMGYDEPSIKFMARNIVRDVVGGSRQFQKAQRLLIDEMEREKKPDSEIYKETENLYQQYQDTFCKDNNITL